MIQTPFSILVFPDRFIVKDFLKSILCVLESSLPQIILFLICIVADVALPFGTAVFLCVDLGIDLVR